jgi:hypothetical protein
MNAKSLISNKPLVLIVLAFLIAKFFFLIKYHLPIWDEAVYLGMGKYIYSFGSSGIWEILRPPALPALIGSIWKFNLPYIKTSEILMIAFAAGTIILTYLIANKVFDKKTAIIASALLAASPVFYLYSSFILTEIPSTFFVLTSLYLFISKKYYLSGSAAAVSMLFKFPNGLLLLALLTTITLPHIIKNIHLLKAGNILPLINGLKRRSFILPFTKITAAFIIVTLPFLIFNYIFYRAFTSNPYDAMFRPFILGAWHQSNPAKLITDTILNYSFYVIQTLRQHIIFILAIASIFICLKKKWYKDQAKLLLGTTLAIYFGYFTYISNKDERFLIIFLPLIAIFTASAFIELTKTLTKKKLIGQAASVLLTILLILSFGIAITQDISSYNFRSTSEPEVVSELYKAPTNLAITGPVLTAEPVFSAFNDNKFFPYYFTSFEGIPKELKALNEWEQNESFEAVIYSQQTLYCLPKDEECQQIRESLNSVLKSNYEEVFEGSYYQGTINYSIFLNSSYSER